MAREKEDKGPSQLEQKRKAKGGWPRSKIWTSYVCQMISSGHLDLLGGGGQI